MCENEKQNKKEKITLPVGWSNWLIKALSPKGSSFLKVESDKLFADSAKGSAPSKGFQEAIFFAEKSVIRENVSI